MTSHHPIRFVVSKTLVIILNHNLPELTDSLYHELKQFEGDHYDLMIMDNGSRIKYRSQYTSLFLEENIFWGGALNVAFQIILDEPGYDSLLFLNNDIELNGNGFVDKLRDIIFNQDYAILSPCLAGAPQPFRQMQCWGNQEVRTVKWIDMMAPIFRRDVIELIGQFDSRLNYGWGQPLVCWKVCLENNLRTGVCDYISILHYGRQTFSSGRLRKKTKGIFSLQKKLNHQGFAKLALAAKHEYFKSWTEYRELVNYGYNYADNHSISAES